jgi:hypothetical protein
MTKVSSTRRVSTAVTAKPFADNAVTKPRRRTASSSDRQRGGHDASRHDAVPPRKMQRLFHRCGPGAVTSQRMHPSDSRQFLQHRVVEAITGAWRWQDLAPGGARQTPGCVDGPFDCIGSAPEEGPHLIFILLR